VLDLRDIGHRVVVRRFVREAKDGRPLFTDVIGELLEFGPDELLVRSRDGALHRIRRDDVAAAKRVPPWRPSPRGIREVERVAAEGWPAPDTAPLGDWLLRAAEGFSNRANSALAVGDPGRSDAVDVVRAWYRDRGLVPRVTTPLPLSAAIADALAAGGWTAQPTTLVMTAALPLGEPDLPVQLDTAPGDAWLALAAARKNGLPAAAHHVLSAPPEVRFAAGYAEGPLVAIGRGVRTGRWLGVSLVEVVPEARRQGWAQAVVRTLARWAADSGATQSYLQVEESNAPAVALYEGMGYRAHHTYVTWRDSAG